MGIVEKLWAELCPHRENELHRLASEIERLRHRLASASPRARRHFESESQGQRAILHAGLTEIRRGQLLSPPARRDMTTLVRRLYTVVDILDADDLSGGGASARLAVRYSEVDVAELVRMTAGAFRELASERRIVFTVDAPDELPAELDIEKVEEVVLNLLFNAFKHTPCGGSISVRAAADPPAAGIIIGVSDSGPGIRSEQTELLFQRSRFADRGVFMIAEGIGFSLASSRDLASLHGGTLVPCNNPGRGVTFAVYLPRLAPRGLATADTTRCREGFATRVARVAADELRAEATLGSMPFVRDGRALVLVVDDNRSIQRILADGLGHYNVAAAFDGAEGLRLAESLRPDIILADLVMPEMDGETMIRQLRSRPMLADIPIVVLTSKQDPADELRLLHNGVQDFVHKPFLLPEVQSRVHNLVAAKRARDLLGVLVDRQQLDLEKLAAEVAQQQRDLYVAFEQVGAARTLAENASRVKSNFLRMMSHELKTPIAAMQLHLHLMRQMPEVAASPALLDAATRIGNSSQRLLHLTETMLEWARVESGRTLLDPTTFELPGLLTALAEDLADLARPKGVDLTVQASGPLPHVTTDRRLLRLVLMNLVSRAVQLTEKGSVELHAAHRQGIFRVSVHDGGHSMSEAERADLLEPTQPDLDLHHRSGSGSGLGLYVVRDIARAIDADIEVGTGQGPGNTLTLCLRNVTT